MIRVRLEVTFAQARFSNAPSGCSTLARAFSSLFQAQSMRPSGVYAHFSLASFRLLQYKWEG
jgi:hypothetical protein